jgi:hypothetical protein
MSSEEQAQSLRYLGEFASNVHKVRGHSWRICFLAYLILGVIDGFQINEYLDQMNSQVVGLNEKMRSVEQKMVPRMMASFAEKV